MNGPDLLIQLRTLETHLAQDRHAEAAALCQALIAAPLPARVYGLLGQTAQRLGQYDAMLLAARKGVAAQPQEVAPRLRLAECYLYAGHADQCLAELEQLEALARHDGPALQLIGNLYVHGAAHSSALRCFERAVELHPERTAYQYNLATSCVALGQLERAEALFDQVIARTPADFGAYVNRSMLRTWSGAENHIDALRRQLAKLAQGQGGAVPLCYALAKELEDVGDFEAAFAYLERGAAARRAQLSYRVEHEVAALDAIAHNFGAGVFAAPAPDPAPGPTPVFVVGLPRSGTTLVERILGAHTQIGSVGEVNNLAFAVMQLAAGPGGKLGMIARSARIDPQRLQEVYLRGLGAYGLAQPYVINKTPENYLYLGLIALSMPQARVLHLHRHPLDSCFAMYKTLFRMGYPYSYSLEDLGHYYLAYHRLMQHWRATLPDRFLDVGYEDLVADQEGGTRRMLSYCGVGWEDACLDFHRNAAPSATASAAQVRRPLYQSAVARWQRYERQLRPLADFLTAHGIDCA